ncbi:hypothetical protein GCM10010326_74590 [Streptomyces xanthochromogenes]|uniref:Uncharacterized protein n=1 Tax=Streptomyces xanthochromogenes TaxID=67384 RepID=A0ABQ3AXC8_9ACTN|nr:hypothetical protein GCM10010326_74590 [Streptomyces xanthochromogenes]
MDEEAGEEADEEGIDVGWTEVPYGLLPMSLCEMNDQPTQPAQSTAAITIPANSFPSRSSTDRRPRCPPNNKASRSRRRRTETDSSNWLS